MITPTKHPASAGITELERNGAEAASNRSPRYPQWLGGPFRKNQSSSKRELTKRLEALETDNKDMAEQLDFLEKRLRHVTRERDLVRRQLFRRSRGERRSSDVANITYQLDR